jgi:class 3 adenylate cyclase
VKDWLATRSLAAEAENLELKGFERPISAFRLG